MDTAHVPRWRDARTYRLVVILYENLSADRVDYLFDSQEEIIYAYEVFIVERHAKLHLAINNHAGRLAEKLQETSLDLAFWIQFAQVMQSLADISHENAALVRAYHEVIDQTNLG